MSDFIQVTMTFPTLIYSVLLAFCVVYWLIAATGAVEPDAIDGLFDLHHDAGTHHAAHADGDGGIGLGAILSKLGLSGVPIMVILTVLSFCGWLVTYFVQLFLLQPMPGLMRWVLGAAVLIGALIPGIAITSLLLRPVAKLLTRLTPPETRSVLGRHGIVISPSVDADGGRVSIEDGGAGMILQARTQSGITLQRGDAIVLIHHDPDLDLYEVIPATEFQTR